MAKWGQGDPRWIVEERADATNVNNWHWTERDASQWSKQKLKELLVGITVDSEEGSCQITDLKKAEGEASCNNRKGRLIIFYEWDLKLTWKGILKGTGDKQRGSIAIPNLSEENDIEDIEISICRKKGEGDTLKDLMKTKGVQKIREALACYLHSLRTEFTQGMVLSTQSRKKTSEFAKQGLCGHTVVDTVGVRIPTCKLILKDTFVSSAAELYKAFTSQEELRKFSGAESVAEAQKGGKFSLYNGEVTGEFLELKENDQIDMRWRCRNWTAEHYASVTVKLLDVSGQAQVQVECKNIPAAEEQSTRLCWQRTYFDPLKRLLSHCAEMPTE
nr:PREDICTED: activator of 90 kDa heat shock protein ATPase homolog 2 [Lepisosteus oculatus]